MEATRNEKYRAFCRENGQMPDLIKDWYLDAVYGDKWEAICIERDDEIVAVLPYFLEKNGIFKYIYQKSISPYMGIYIIPQFRKTESAKEIIKEAIKSLPDYGSFKQYFNCQYNHCFPFEWHKIEEDQVSFIRLTSMDKIEITAHQNGWTIDDSGDLEDFFDLLKRDFKKRKKDLDFTLDDLLMFDSQLYKNCRNKVFFARHEEHLKAAIYITLGDQTAYLNWLVVDEEDRVEVSQKLLYSAIQYCVENEEIFTMEIYDNALFDKEYLLSLGAKELDYYQIRKYKSMVLKMMDKVR